MPLVINALGDGHTGRQTDRQTHRHTHIPTCKPKQFQVSKHVSLRPTCAWFKSFVLAPMAFLRLCTFEMHGHRSIDVNNSKDGRFHHLLSPIQKLKPKLVVQYSYQLLFSCTKNSGFGM